MLKKLPVILASTLFCSNLMAMTFSYDLQPHTPDPFPNPFFQAIKGECKFTLKEETAIVHVKIIRRTGTINGQPVKEGDQFDITVTNGSTMTGTAQPAFLAELTNTSDYPIHAQCQGSTVS